MKKCKHKQCPCPDWIDKLIARNFKSSTMDFRTLLFRTSLTRKLFNSRAGQKVCFNCCSSHSSHGHEAIKIRGEGGGGGDGSSPQQRKLSKEELEARQKAMMAKNLPKRRAVEGVKKVVLISSAKGGVGKSTVAVNLAVGTKQRFPDKQISLLDADVFGPSLPRMMNLEGEPELDKDGKMVPLQNYGVKCMSLGFLVSDAAPVVWRGLMVMSAIEKLIRGVNWSPSDILFVDMPPGTGDTQLSFAQSVEVSGAVIVTTPQQVALQDAIKGVQMFKKTGIPILGCVVNMASFLCPCCNKEIPVVKSNNLKQFSNEYDVPILGQLPMDFSVSNACDEGYPVVLQESNSQTEKFNEIIDKLEKKLI